jgi:NDP-sugar pyrophosphorylase family protein
MPIGDMPVLEILLRRLRAAGFDHVHLAVGYLAELVEAYFRDGARFGIQIEYLREDKPLGTAGPLAALETDAARLLVMNGDLVTTMDFRALLDRHAEAGAAATIAIRGRDIPLDFGIVTVADGFVAGFEEKPTLHHDVSMGVYVFEANVVQLIPADERLDFPDLLQILLDGGRAVAVHRSDDFWVDIGRHEDYERALDSFDELRPALLGET